jgi:NAD(P)H-hydrate epimerase
MDQLVSSSVMAAIDDDAQKRYNIPGLSLMETAGHKAWEAVQHTFDHESAIVFLCGGGNNGGDALVMARLAYDQGLRDLSCILAGKHLSPSCIVQRSIVEAYGIRTIQVAEHVGLDAKEAISRADMLVDGLAGTGLKGPLRGTVEELVLLANETKAHVVAIDIPSGIGDTIEPGRPHIHADRTLTMGLAKSACYHPVLRTDCGEIAVLDPSFPSSLLARADCDCLLFRPREMRLERLSPSAYKNSRGHLAVFGGSSRYTGAIRLASRAAFASRAGLVSLFCDPDVYPIAATESPSVMVRPLSEQGDCSAFDALLAGPGWSDGREKLLQTLFATGKPMVLDADGIRAYARLLKNGLRPSHGPLVITPHLGELRALAEPVFGSESATLGKEDAPASFLSRIARLSEELDATLVVKSSLVYIVCPGHRTHVLEGLNPSLGVAGSGDVLSGIVAGLMAGGISPFDSACIGSGIHQEAGRLAGKSAGYYDSEKLVQFIGKAVGETER